MYSGFDDTIIRERQRRMWGYNDTPWFIILLLAIYFLIAQIIPLYLYTPVNILGSSMEPTLYEDDRVILFKQGKINYGDIVVLYAPDIRVGNGKIGEDIIKRVMGLPGDTVWFEKVTKDGRTDFYFHRLHSENGMDVETVLYNEYYVIKGSDGKPLYIPPNDNGTSEPNFPDEHITLGEGEYYVLGDNRPSSHDSRYADVGKVSKSWIKGKALFIIRNGRLMLFKKPGY